MKRTQAVNVKFIDKIVRLLFIYKKLTRTLYCNYKLSKTVNQDFCLYVRLTLMSHTYHYFVYLFSSINNQSKIIAQLVNQQLAS